MLSMPSHNRERRQLTPRQHSTPSAPAPREPGEEHPNGGWGSRVRIRARASPSRRGFTPVPYEPLARLEVETRRGLPDSPPPQHATWLAASISARAPIQCRYPPTGSWASASAHSLQACRPCNLAAGVLKRTVGRVRKAGRDVERAAGSERAIEPVPLGRPA
jgi:hypothetical protein